MPGDSSTHGTWSGWGNVFLPISSDNWANASMSLMGPLESQFNDRTDIRNLTVVILAKG